jgi:hypothetical protein
MPNLNHVHSWKYLGVITDVDPENSQHVVQPDQLQQSSLFDPVEGQQGGALGPFVPTITSRKILKIKQVNLSSS